MLHEDESVRAGCHSGYQNLPCSEGEARKRAGDLGGRCLSIWPGLGLSDSGHCTQRSAMSWGQLPLQLLIL